MQFETCLIGGALRLGDDARIVIHRRQGERIVLGASAPVGSGLIFERTPVCSISGAAGIWSDLFSLQAIPSIHAGPVRGARVASSHSLPIARIRCTSGLSRAAGCGACFRATGEYRNRFAGTRRARIAPVPGRWRVPAPSLERLNACH